RQLRVRRGEHPAAQRQQGQRDQGLPEVGDHHGKRRVLLESRGIPAVARRAGLARRGADRGDRLVTATLPGHSPASAAAPGAAAGAGGERGGGRAPRRRGATTPTAMLALLATLVVLSLAWGAFGGWVASAPSSAASDMVAVHEPLSLDARQLYESVADADVTITAALLASPRPPLAPLQRYQHDIATAAADLARIRAGPGGGNQPLNAALAAPART